MFILDDFDFCGACGTKQAFAIIKTLLTWVRIAVPIGLIALTIVDVSKKTLKPDDKDGQKKILTRLIASVIVFFVPVMVRFVLRLVDAGMGNGNQMDSIRSQSCYETWEKAKLAGDDDPFCGTTTDNSDNNGG